jgi:hypothetical protein
MIGNGKNQSIGKKQNVVDRKQKGGSMQPHRRTLFVFSIIEEVEIGT